jgi:non-specific serine/threonine protein kinase/serine/threonine-protein kinase
MNSSDQAMGLSPAQRACVDSLLDELLDLPEDQRISSLHERRIEDLAVAGEVESLLRAARASGAFLGMLPRPPVEETVEGSAIGTRLGAWRLIRLIGHGGMGEVYEASRIQGDFDHRVAIKVLQREAAAQLERFQAERQILARLEHPGIARLYDGGLTADERPFMVMEYVEGRAITEFCLLTQANLQKRLRLFIQICDAVSYAHQNLIVHRDLKPSNILVTGDGTVKLLDFGIAKLLDAQNARITQATLAPLTPICAAPEQLSGGLVTTATDVYALGLLLFELLTGVHPWVGVDTPILQAMRAILHRQAPVASALASTNLDAPIPVRSIRGDLDAIVAKTLRSEPSQRYSTVESLKLEIERMLNGEPIDARKGVPLYVVGRLLRRYRWAVSAVALVLIAAVIGLSWQAHQVRLERDMARREGSREEAVRFNLTRLFHAAIADPATLPLSANKLIGGGAQHSLHESRDRPEIAGQMVLAPADIYGALEDVTGAASLLEGFVGQSNSRIEPAALADARQKLADIELLRGQLDYAGQLLDQADTFWSSSPRPYLEERLAGLVVRARLQRARGDLDASIATTREAIVQRISLSGHDHRETALLYNALAISLAIANRFNEALAANRESTAIYQALGLGDGIDAQIVMANRGILELRMGRLQAAEMLLNTSLTRERSLAGESTALAAAMGYYGRVLSITNRNEAAAAVLREAADIAARSAGPDSPLALQNQLFLGEAESAMGNRIAANTTLNDVRVAALAQYGAAHPLALRTQIALAQLAATEGDYERAVSQLVSAIAGLRKSGVFNQAILAQALEILGDVELSTGRVQQANTALQEAVQIRERTSGDTWELAEARERLGETQAKGGFEGAADLLEKAARDLELQLGAAHPETVRAKAALAYART